MNRLRDLVFRARCQLGLDRGGIDWGPAGDDDGLVSSAELWADFERAQKVRP